MQKRKLTLATSAAVGLSALSYQAARAASATTAASAELVSDIQITRSQNLSFGKLLNSLGTGASETVKFTANGTDLAAGTNVTDVSGTAQPATFILSVGDAKETGQTITLSANALAKGTTALVPTLPWKSLKAQFGTATNVTETAATPGGTITAKLTNATIPTTGKTLEVFGGIVVQGGDPDGTYTGTITVTANRS